MYDFDTLLQRKNTDCTKWDALARDYGRDDLMPFWVADSDFPVLPEIVQAIRSRATMDQTFGYTIAGDRYYNSLINWNRNRHGLEIAKETVLPVPGVVTALSLCLLALTREQDKVLINPPVYTPFFDTVRSLDRHLVLSPLVERNGRYEMDFEDMERKMAEGVKLFILCSPQNPTGRIWSREELEEASRLCRKYEVALVSDEIHADIVYPGHRHIPILHVDPHAVLMTAPSKTFNIAGLKSSYMVIPDEAYREKISAWAHKMHLYINVFACEATVAAYENGAAWVDELNRYLEQNARFTVDFLAEKLPAVRAYVPESTYLMWLDFSGLGLCGEEINRKMVEEARVALNPGEEYGEGYDQFMRLNIATPRAYLTTGLERIASAFSSHS